MKRLAVVITLASLAVLGFAAHMLLATWRLYNSASYAPGTYTSHQAGGMEADGGGIYAPGFLLLGLGLFLLKWALNLWRSK